MAEIRRSGLFRWSGMLGLLATGALAGCDAILTSEAGLADQVAVSVTGSAAVPLLLITSTNFLAEYDRLTDQWQVSLTRSDTVRITSLPFAQTRNIRGRDRYLVRLVNPDSAVTVDVGLEVRLDGKLVYTERAFLRDASLEYFTWFSPHGGP